MEERTRTIAATRLLWSLVLGLGLALALLWVVMRIAVAEAQSPPPGLAVAQATSQQVAEATQAINPGFTLDLAYETVWGMLNPGDRVTVTRTTGGVAYGAAEADGVGFFRTPLWQSNGQPIDAVAGDAFQVYVNGTLAATLSPLDITGQVDVLSDQVTGTVSGLAMATPVTVTLGGFGQMIADVPQIVTTVDGSGDFIADFSGIADIGPHQMAQVQYRDGNGNTVQSYVYPSEVFRLLEWDSVQGYAASSTLITVTIYDPGPVWSAQTVPEGPHGTYDVSLSDYGDLGFSESIEVDLGGTTQITVSVNNLEAEVDDVADQVTGQTVASHKVRGYVWDGVDGTYNEDADISDVGGNYTLNVPMEKWHAIYVAYADSEGDEVAYSADPPAIMAYPLRSAVIAWDYRPNRQVTFTLDTGEVLNVGCDASHSCGWHGPWDFAPVDPGHTITVELSNGTMMSMTVPSITLQADTANDRAFGDANIPGRMTIHNRQWQYEQYPIHGWTAVSTTASSPYTATFSGFDVRDGNVLLAFHYDTSGHLTQIYQGNVQAYFEANPTHNYVQGVRPAPDEVITATLYTADGQELISGTDPQDPGQPWDPGWHFHINFGEYGPYEIEIGHWITVTSENGWEAGLQVPDLTIEIDQDSEMIWGEGPKSLLFVEHNQDGRFVPVDDYALDRAFFGDDIQWGDWIAANYQAPNGNRVQTRFQWPHVVAHYQMDGSNDVWGQTSIAGNTIHITITDEYGGFVDAGTTFPGSGDQGPTSYRLDFPDGTIVPSNTVHVDFGSGFAYSTTVVSITAQADPDSDVVTVTAPISSWVNMNADGPNGWWESNWSYGEVQVGASGYVTFDLSVDGYDIIPGTNFNVHVEDTQYSFWLPAPELSINKWNTNQYARPDGVVVYGIDYWNNGNGVATDTLIVDTLPMSTTWAGDTSGVEPTLGAGGIITWNLGDVEAGNGDSFMVTLDIFDLNDGDTIDQNCAVITTTTPGDYDLGNNGPSCAGPVDVWDDDVEVSVNKSPNPNDPTPGQEFFYTIETCNYRGAATGPLWLTDTLPLSTTLLGWESNRGNTTYWTEVITTGGQLVLYAPGIPGDECEYLYLTLFLDADVPISTTLENTIVITAAGDVYLDNNGPHVNTDAHVSGPRYDMVLNKSIHNMVPVPGGWVNYFFDYQNNGNMPAHIWITDTVPTGLRYDHAFWGGGQPQENDPFPPPTVIGDKLVWDLGVVSVGDSAWFHVQMNISGTLNPGDTLTNCATIGITATENTPGDNTSCVPITLNDSGPNLRVTKNSWWNGDWQLGYQIHFENIGDQTVSDVWITDTLPVSTTWDGWWHMEGFDWGRLVSDTQSSDTLRWQFSNLDPGDYGWLSFNANLDTPGQPLRWYTNTVEITTPPDDVNTDDNIYLDVAFSGGEVESVDLDLYRTHMWGCAYSMPITITSAQAQMVVDWDTCWDEEFGDTFDPGDVVTVTAGAGIQPVVIHIPDLFSAYASSITDTVWGQIYGAYYEPVEVDLWGFPTQHVQTDGNGNYSATFSDVPRGAQGDVNYSTEIDYADVTFHRRFQTLDLILNVDYYNDNVYGNYEAGHTVWITVTESDGLTVKATAELTTGPIPWWGGQSGFESQGGDWMPQHPDIQAGDWVFGLVDNDQATQVHIGQITGTVDVDNDSITGRIYAPWFTETLDVRCDEWAGIGAPGQDSTAGPDGDPPYYCEWDPGTEWDVQPGQDIGVWYVGPDLNWVANAFREPQPYLTVYKRANGNPAEGGNFVFTINYWNGSDDRNYAEDVVISDTLQGGMTYITDTSGLPHTGTGAPNDPLVWNVGTVPGNRYIYFDVFVAITASEGDPITNTVEITTSSRYNQSSPEERTDEWSGTVQANDTWLTLGKWIDGPNPAPGTDFTWMVNVCNEGSTASSEVTMTDTLPISTTLLSWWGDTPGWTEVLNTSDQLVLSYPSILDGQCTATYLRFHLDQNAWIGMGISNTATITASNDLNGGSTIIDWRDVYGPYSNLYVRRDWLQGQLAAGGELSYGVQYGNDGNAPADDVLLTYTLPVSTTFDDAWWYDQYGQHPFTPDTITADYVAWDLGTLENGSNTYFEVRLDVDGSAASGTVLTSTFEITPHPTDFHYDDNAVTWAETLNDSGPNLEAHKQNYQWNGTGRIQYEIRAKNRGTERLEPVWITDTYPISTTWDGNWWPGHGPWITTTHDATNHQIIFWLEYLDPGETASINFDVAVDGAIYGTQGLFFTNTLEAPLPGDVYPADNYDQVVAYAGPDVYTEKWLRSGEPRPGEIVTFTVKLDNRSAWQDMSDMWGSHITDTLPPEMAFITATAPWDPNQRWMPGEVTATNSMTWSWGTPWPNDANYFAIVARITDTVQSGDVITNVIEYWNDNPDDIDLSLDNNVFELAVTILDPVFEVGKVYEGDVAGTVVTYTLTVTNVGNYPGTMVVLSDTVPALLENVDGNYDSFDGMDAVWTFDTISPFGGLSTGRFSATLPCTAGLSIVNDTYLIVSSAEGISSPLGAEVSFDVLAPAVSAGFTHTLGTILAADTVFFTNTSATDGTGLNYTWNFGDGSAVVTTQEASHVYSRHGSYTVVLTATDSCGYQDVAIATVGIGPRFAIAKSWTGSGVAGTAVTYALTVTNLGSASATVIVTDTVPEYLSDHSGTAGFPYVGWRLGPIAPDGGTATGEFNATITCTAGLDIVNDDYGVRWSNVGAVGPEGDPVSFTVSAPTINAALTHTPAPIVVGDTVSFTATAGTDGTGLSYMWNLGTGPTSGGLTATHVYTRDGVYTVAFTATDTCNYSEAATTTITVNAPNLVADFDYEPKPANILVDGTVTFTDTSTTDGPSIVAWAWRFGDDSAPAFTQNTTHTYGTAGTYTVTLVVTDALGYSDTVIGTNAVTVTLACTPVTGVTFTYAPPDPVIQSPVVFTATVAPSNATALITYTWDLGDGDTGSSRVVNHTYALSDTYTVIVTATNCMGTGVVTHSEEVVVSLVDGAQTPVDPALGGTLIYTDGQGNPTTVQVPGGATTETVTLLLTPVVSPTQPVSPGLRFINHTFDLEAYVGHRRMSGYVFSKPVTITIQYSDADVAGVDEENLLLRYWTGSVWDDATNTCTPPSTYTRDLAQNVLGVPICHLSRFSVLGESLNTIYLPVVLRES